MSGWTEQLYLPLPVLAGSRAFKKGSLSAIVNREPFEGNGSLCWHLSISHPTRYPRWNEIKDARYALLPADIWVAQFLPPREHYVNIHPNCFHLWEVALP